MMAQSSPMFVTRMLLRQEKVFDIFTHIFTKPITFSGFQPKYTALHHQEWIFPLIREAFEKAKVRVADIDAIAYTKGPGMGAPLRSVAIVVRTLAQIWKKPIAAVNHCVAHIEMGRLEIQFFFFGMRCKF